VVTKASMTGAQSDSEAVVPAPPPSAPPAVAAPPPLPKASWYASLGGDRKGPMDDKALASLISSGKVSRDTLVWRQGMGEWTPAGKLPELQSHFAAQPPPLPPG